LKKKIVVIEKEIVNNTLCEFCKKEKAIVECSSCGILLCQNCEVESMCPHCFEMWIATVDLEDLEDYELEYE